MIAIKIKNQHIVLEVTRNKVNTIQVTEVIVSLIIQQLLKGQGIKATPRDIAKKIMDNTPKHVLVEKLEVAGAGFVNLWLGREYGYQALSNILQHGVNPPPLSKSLRVVIDFSSPNIAKEMHVGHLR